MCWTACLADARPLDELAALLEYAGLVVEELETYDELLRELVERVDGRLRLAGLLADQLPDSLRDVTAAGKAIVSAASPALDAGVIGYGAVYATRP